jgi:hypothetical protein
MERKEVSKTSDKPIDKVLLLALELEANHIDLCCLSEVRRDSCEFKRERDINSTALGTAMGGSFMEWGLQFR